MEAEQFIASLGHCRSTRSTNSKPLRRISPAQHVSKRVYRHESKAKPKDPIPTDMEIEPTRYELVFSDLGPMLYSYGQGPKMEASQHLAARANRLERQLALKKQGLRDHVVVSHF